MITAPKRIRTEAEARELVRGWLERDWERLQAAAREANQRFIDQVVDEVFGPGRPSRDPGEQGEA